MVALLGESPAPAPADELRRKERIGAALHRFIRTAAGNDMISHSLELVEMQTRRVWHEGLAIEGRINKAFEDHQKILAHIADREERAAEALMREHIVEASGIYFDILFSR